MPVWDYAAFTGIAIPSPQPAGNAGARLIRPLKRGTYQHKARLTLTPPRARQAMWSLSRRTIAQRSRYGGTMPTF